MKTRVESVIARGTTDLFGEPDLPDGFRYIPDVLSHAEEASFVQRFEKLPMKPLNSTVIWANAAYSPSAISMCLQAKNLV
jgi:hypothetical protein